MIAEVLAKSIIRIVNYPGKGINSCWAKVGRLSIKRIQ